MGDQSKVAVITGAASGIGQAYALRCAREGMNVVVGSYPGDPHDPQRTLDAIREVGTEGVIVEVDVRNSTELDAMMLSAINEFGRIDQVVASAGILRQSPLDSLSDSAWDDLLSVDLTGVMRTFRACAPHMDAGSALVAVSSIMGSVYGWADHAHYAAAKSGVVGLCRSLAVELAPRGIRVNTVIPGVITTPQSSDSVNSLGPEGLRQAADRIPLNRAGEAEEVADAIWFLASRESRYITGQNLVVDGGLTVAVPV